MFEGQVQLGKRLSDAFSMHNRLALLIRCIWDVSAYRLLRINDGFSVYDTYRDSTVELLFVIE